MAVWGHGQGGSNWYVYANDNPLRFTDPTGLSDSPSSDLVEYNLAYQGQYGGRSAVSADYSNDLNNFLPFKPNSDWGFSSGGHVRWQMGNLSQGTTLSLSQLTFNPAYIQHGPQGPNHLGLTFDKGYFDPVTMSVFQKDFHGVKGWNAFAELGVDSPSIGGFFQNAIHESGGWEAPRLVREHGESPIVNLGSSYENTINLPLGSSLNFGVLATTGSTQSSLGGFFSGKTDLGSRGALELTGYSLIEGGRFRQEYSGAGIGETLGIHAIANLSASLNVSTPVGQASFNFGLSAEGNNVRGSVNNTFWTAGAGLKF